MWIRRKCSKQRSFKNNISHFLLDVIFISASLLYSHLNAFASFTACERIEFLSDRAISTTFHDIVFANLKRVERYGTHVSGIPLPRISINHSRLPYVCTPFAELPICFSFRFVSFLFFCRQPLENYEKNNFILISQIDVVYEYLFLSSVWHHIVWLLLLLLLCLLADEAAVATATATAFVFYAVVWLILTAKPHKISEKPISYRKI